MTANLSGISGTKLLHFLILEFEIKVINLRFNFFRIQNH